MGSPQLSDGASQPADTLVPMEPQQPEKTTPGSGTSAQMRNTIVLVAGTIVVILLVVAFVVDGLHETRDEALERCRAEAETMPDVEYVAVYETEDGWGCRFGVGSP